MSASSNKRTSRAKIDAARRDAALAKVRTEARAAARGRAVRAKTGITFGSAVAFGAALLLAKSFYASHEKHRALPLAAPSSFVSTVRESQLHAGSIAPAQQPPQIETSQS